MCLGLHRKIEDGGMTPVERERRRRLWWTVYSFERFVLGVDC
jgi:hypothetical protein